MIFENGVAPFALRYHKKQISKIKKINLLIICTHIIFAPTITSGKKFKYVDN